MNKKTNNILEGYDIFLKRIFDNLEKDGIDVSKYFLDHLCYRVNTIEQYNDLKKEFAKYGTLLAENLISGRNIATFKLFSPLIYKNRKIDIIELPSPKPGSSYIEGFEHVEFVIDKNFSDFLSMYPFVNFNTKSIKKEHNPEIKISYGNITVKFHHKPLENVL